MMTWYHELSQLHIQRHPVGSFKSNPKRGIHTLEEQCYKQGFDYSFSDCLGNLFLRK